MSGQILTWRDLTADVSRDVDVVVVGSGAGGAVLAAGLAEAGLSVVILEAGSHVTRDQLTLSEADAFPLMYQERGTRATSDQAISILQGRAVGGSTMINWTTCFRTPERILAHWRARFGLELDGSTLTPHFEAVEARLNIAPWEAARANPNNRVILDGAAKLGWEAAVLRRNVKGCADSGYCGLGCPVDGKQSMGITYLPDAVAAGAELLANVQVERIEMEGTRARAVVGRVHRPDAAVADGPQVTVRAKVVVSAGGAINGPALLLRSGLDGGGRVGKRTFLHPVVATMGRFAERINPFYGAPQSAGSHQFIDRGPDRVGFFLEAAPLQPMISAIAFNAVGPRLHELMAELPRVNGLLALHVDGVVAGDEGGTVRLGPSGQPKLDYPVGAPLIEAFRHSHEALARLQLAAGAEVVGTLHADPLWIRGEADLRGLDERRYGAHEHALFTAHQMGGCGMGADPATSAVDPSHRLRGTDNVFVVDGSVLPTALGVNPSQTIYGLAHRAHAFVGAAV